MRLLIDDHALGWDEAWSIMSRALRVHQPHGAARGARAVGRLAFGHCCRVTCRSSTRSTAASSTRCAPGSRATRRACSGCRSSQEGPEQRCGWRTWRSSGSAHVNGVSELHSRILRERLFHDFAEMWPKQVRQPDQRRDAAALAPQMQPGPVRDHHVEARRGLGDRSARASRSSPERSRRCAPRSSTPSTPTRSACAPRVEKTLAFSLSPQALFDVQVKRIHEYKRQLLPILHAVHLHLSSRVAASSGCRASCSSPARRRPATTWPSGSSAWRTTWGRRSTATSERASGSTSSSSRTTRSRSPSSSSPRPISPSRCPPRGQRRRGRGT